MPWTSVNFSWPASTADIQAGIDGVLTGANGELTAADGRLATVPNTNIVVNPLSTSAANAGSAREQLSGLLNINAHYLIVHPWQQGIGRGEGVHRHLSAPNAVQALADKLNDVQDYNLPNGNIEAVGVLIHAATLPDFSQQCAMFNAVFPIPELQLLQRRSEQLETLNVDKVLLPEAALNARWADRQLTQLDAAKISFQQVSNQVAIAAAYDSENIDPLAELQNLIAKKQSMVSTRQQDYDSFVNQLSGGNGLGFHFVSGSRQQLSGRLLSAPSPGHENVLTAGLLFIAAPGELIFLKEALGL